MNYQIIQDLLITLITKLIKADRPQKIISALILCRCLIEISQSFNYQSMLSLLNVHYDEEKQSYQEYNVIASILPNSKYALLQLDLFFYTSTGLGYLLLTVP